MTANQIFNLGFNLGAILVIIWYFSGPLRRRLGWMSLTERQVQKHREAIANHEATIRKIAAELQSHMQDQIEDLDHMILIAEDLARFQPERAEMLELSLVELRRHRDHLSEGRTLAAIDQLPALRGYVELKKLHWRKRRKRNDRNES